MLQKPTMLSKSAEKRIPSKADIGQDRPTDLRS